MAFFQRFGKKSEPQNPNLKSAAAEVGQVGHGRINPSLSLAVTGLAAVPPQWDTSGTQAGQVVGQADQGMPMSIIDDPEERTAIQSVESEQEAFSVASIMEFAQACHAGDSFSLPLEWLSEAEELREAVEKKVRERNDSLRIWFVGQSLICRLSSRIGRFRGVGQKRIETMWSEESGWQRWNSQREEYEDAPELNKGCGA